MNFKHVVSCGLKYLTDKNYRFYFAAKAGKYDMLSDEEYLKLMFSARMGKKLDLEHPVTYNEKLQWLKLHDRNPLYTKLVDKYEVKDYVSNIIGHEYIIPTIGVWDHFDQINFNELPNQFVLKCTHDSGGVVICKDRNKFSVSKASHILHRALSHNFYSLWREWLYKNVKPRIIAEQYMEDTETEELRDYKFFCFDGVVKAMFIASERQNQHEDTKFDFFDEKFNHLPLRNGHPNARVVPQKPKNLDLMIKLAQKLGENIPHVRIDFYEVNGKVYFGEMTFYHWSGFVPFEPEEWDYKFGEWINLPDKTE